jgi:peptide/nickel transport system substrate-binding protein
MADDARNWMQRLVCALILMLVAGCAPGERARGTGEPGSQARESGTVRAPKRLVVSTQVDPRAFHEGVNRASTAGPPRGGPELAWLLNSGLTVVDNRGDVVGQLAETAPTIENGRWQLFPDGRMETSWTIRAGAQWHDGTAFTSDDLLFTADVVRDPELAAAFRDSAYDLIEAIEAPDPRTVVVRWKGPLIEADGMFSQRLAVPLPRHLLEQSYREDKGRFLSLPYWLGEFVGSGPFRLRSVESGSHILLQANDGYALGRPKLDELEVRIIVDPNALMSNILAGAVGLTLGYGLSLEQALELRRIWSDGSVEMAPNGWLALHPQFVNPRLPIVTDRRFRQALIQGIDRQEMVDTLQYGMVPVAYTFLNPAEPEFPAVEASLVRYEYNPAQAVRQIEDLGYTRGPNGLFVDGTGQPLSVEIRVTEGLEIQVKATFAVADALQRIGVGVDPVVRSVQSNNNREEVATFPNFRLMRNSNTLSDMKNLLITKAPVAENGYTGQNFARYMNQELNDLVERYFRTVPRQERIEILRQVVVHQSRELSQMSLFYNVQSVAIGKRVRNVTNGGAQGFNQAWNAHDWDVE